MKAVIQKLEKPIRPKGTFIVEHKTTARKFIVTYWPDNGEVFSGLRIRCEIGKSCVAEFGDDWLKDEVRILDVGEKLILEQTL